MSHFPTNFLWGASTAPHQVEGNNVNSDWWAREGVAGIQRSGDAVDSYHRYAEDMQLLADAGLNSYRFGIEWARIEPTPGNFSRAELAHYRRMIDQALQLGLTPVITLQHFTTPKWFADEGGWLTNQATDRFVTYVQHASSILGDVPYVITMNEPNMQAMTVTIMQSILVGQTTQWQSPTVDAVTDEEGMWSAVSLPDPDPAIGQRLVAAHEAAREVLHATTDSAVGWTVANGALTAQPGAEETLRELNYIREDLYLEAARDDDFVGVQAYSSQEVDVNGLVSHQPHLDDTLVGTAYRPDALALAVRHTWEVTRQTPILVTENGIATQDDEQRIAYTTDALKGLASTMADGIDVRGYLHWSALDNYEWGHWEPTFGLIAVDPKTFERHPKPSLAWLGSCVGRGEV
ncbi:family 1 glycosylhydrolase [Arthrobacter sp. Z1-15]